MSTTGKKLLSGLVFTIGLTGAAGAADYLPPIIEQPVIEVPVVERAVGGWYLRGDIGYDVYKDASFSHTGTTAAGGFFLDESIDRSGSIGIGAGYEFNDWFRADVTAEFRGTEGFAAVDKYNFDCDLAGLSSGSCGGGGIIMRNNMWRGSLTSQVVMANVYASIGSWHGISPFIGGGIGLAFHRVHGVSDIDPSDLGGGGFATDEQTTSFAWNVQAGLAYDITRNLVIETAYRYLDMGEAESGALCALPTNCPGAALAPLQIDDINAHEVRLGLRWRLGGGGHGGGGHGGGGYGYGS